MSYKLINDFETYQAIKYVTDQGWFNYIKMWWDEPILSKNVIVKTIFLPVSSVFYTITFYQYKSELKKFKRKHPEYFL